MRLKTGLIAVALSVVGLTAAAMPATAWAQADQPDKSKATDANTIDRLTFRDGRVVEGKILSETETTITMRVNVAGIEANAEYDKSTILQVERNIKTDATPADDDTTGKPDEPESPAKPADPNAKTVYLLTLKGGLGREINVTPLKEVYKDVKKLEPDIFIIKIDMDFVGYGQQEAKMYAHFFDQFFACHEIAPIFTDDIERDKEWKKKPRLVFWVQEAMGGIAFLPFNGPEIYYTSDARQGGVGYLDKVFAGVGDEVVREKQRALRLAMAEGMAVRGGYAPQIIQAMTRSDYTLSYSLVGGKPVFYEDGTTGKWLLTDNGKGENQDLMSDVIRGRGNDVLQLNAELAFKLGISKGTADTMKQLAYEMGISRDYVMLDNRSGRILKDWAEGVDDAERNIRRLFRDFANSRVEGDYQQRTAARGKRIRILRQIQSILSRYGESINPREIQNYPEQLDQDISIAIEQLKNEQRLDHPP